MLSRVPPGGRSGMAWSRRAVPDVLRGPAGLGRDLVGTEASLDVAAGQHLGGQGYARMLIDGNAAG
jgi:hypothetical protein